MEEMHTATHTIAELKKGEKAVIHTFDLNKIPLKLIELGCFEGSEVEILHKSTLGDPIYLRMNDAYLSIRKEMARAIQVISKLAS